MAKRIPLTLACGDYEIIRALKEGQVVPDGIDLTVLTEMDSTTRHWRFIRNRDFDMAETSASSYVVAKDQGEPVTALPVFLHRRFRHGFVFINTAKGIKSPKDLIGRKVGIKSFLVTAGHWMRGILEHEYGVPHKSLHYFAELDEDIEFAPPAGPEDHAAAARQVGRDDAGRRRARRGDPFQHHQADRRGRPARRPPVSRLQGGGDRLLQEDRHLPDHARARRQAGDRRDASVGADQHVPGVPEGQGDRDGAHGQPAHRAARLVPRGLGGAGSDPRPRPVGIRPDRAQPPHHRDARRLFARAGPDEAAADGADDLFVSVFQGRKRGDEFRI